MMCLQLLSRPPHLALMRGLSKTTQKSSSLMHEYMFSRTNMTSSLEGK